MSSVSRRTFIKIASATAAPIGTADAATAVQDPRERAGSSPHAGSHDGGARETFRYLNAPEVALIEAAVSRLIPSDDLGAGAAEADVGGYIDLQLAGACGAGEPPTYPCLASQHASYFRAAMAQSKSGARNTDPSGQMPQIAKRLGDPDVAALGEYLASLPPPQPLEAALASGRSVAPATTRRSPSTPAASAGSTPRRGTSAGGEGPTTGGAQGPGGSQPPSGERSGNPSQTSRGAGGSSR